MLELIFWLSFSIIVYAYVGYPLLLTILGSWRTNKIGHEKGNDVEPSVSIIIPVYNEESIIDQKIHNTLELDYPRTKLEIIVVSDGSTDNTRTILQEHVGNKIRFYELPERTGKAAALNLGLQKASNEIVVFSDASIILEKHALKNIARGFVSDMVGCISGEDRVVGGGGEGLYGKYELMLRNLESRASSIVGASGCFYAQRKVLCEPFPAGMAPDFFSVLVTVDKGYRALTEPKAVGIMRTVKEPQREFERKVRTLVRGMTTLFCFKRLFNPFRFGLFSVELLSHKLLRWLVGVFLILLFVINLLLAGSKFYLFFLILQIVFYSLALIGWVTRGHPLLFRIPLYFSIVNGAALIAFVKYMGGFRQEVWEPSRRPGDK